jgi:hypothetical protein
MSFKTVLFQVGQPQAPEKACELLLQMQRLGENDFSIFVRSSLFGPECAP